MSVYEVPEPEWERFCQRFVREHRGKSVTVELTDDADDPSASREVIVARRPLERLDVIESRGHDRHVLVSIDGLFGRLNELMLPAPERLRMEQHGEREGGVLRVDSASFRTLLLRFEEPLVPGILDRLS